jgi:excisionase family DNA binding protein
MKKSAFTTSDIALISHHSRETVKRWLEKGEIKGYRVGASGHWRVLPKDLTSFLKRNSIPFPDPAETGYDLKDLAGIDGLPPFCWEFFENSIGDHLRANRRCEDCMVYKTKFLNCSALREEIGHRKIFWGHACDGCVEGLGSDLLF